MTFDTATFDTAPPTDLSIATDVDKTAPVPFEQYLDNSLHIVCTQVVTAGINDSVMSLSAQMIEQNTACLIIMDELIPPEHSASIALGTLQSLNPVGLITERALLQCQALGKALPCLSARDIMQPLDLCIFPPKTPLYLAYKSMVKRGFQYGVLKSRGELVGLISQTSLLKAFDPITMQAILEKTREKLDVVEEQLASVEEQLQQEQLAHQQTQLDFSAAKVDLNQQQCDRTAELAEMNIQLKKDLRKRKRVEDALKQTLKSLQSAQIQVIQNERMSGLGHFVAGVAHEINNPVNFIHGNLTPARQYADDLLALVGHYQKINSTLTNAIQIDSEELEELEELEDLDIEFLSKDFPRLLDSMRSGTERIREIVKSLRNFSRLDEAETKPVDIHEGIENTLLLLSNRLKAQSGETAIRVLKTYSQLPTVECFVSQLNQVFWHLLSNAIDAVRSRNAQETSGIYESDNIATIQIRTEVSDENWIAIYIADNGPGIPQNVRNKIFDPFYTTKPVGKGTGLGLSISHQIVVEKHHGELQCHSTTDQGTEFVIKLPCRPSKTACAKPTLAILQTE